MFQDPDENYAIKTNEAAPQKFGKSQTCVRELGASEAVHSAKSLPEGMKKTGFNKRINWLMLDAIW